MDSVDADLICGVCTKLISDPYSLPCRHTFRLRPCLLSHAMATTARCIHCHEEFDAAKLRPNYAIGAKLCLLTLRRKQEQEQEGKRVENQVVDQHLGVFSFIMCDGVVSLPQPPRISQPCDLGGQRLSGRRRNP
ncbi:hypothetical protein TcWFU_010408 [Taenia crassiceps]|uniref:RING-type domain-containing protein n=1 Tax=Taenia crassiceps TaxID=6207 RepID=A0ABR4QU46_9CEST